MAPDGASLPLTSGPAMVTWVSRYLGPPDRTSADGTTTADFVTCSMLPGQTGLPFYADYGRLSLYLNVDSTPHILTAIYQRPFAWVVGPELRTTKDIGLGSSSAQVTQAYPKGLDEKHMEFSYKNGLVDQIIVLSGGNGCQ